MPALPLLLRLSLIAALLVSALGNAAAAVRMEFEHAAHAPAATAAARSQAQAQPDPASACHQAADAPAAAPADTAGDGGHGDPGQPDCCQSGHCDGVCLQQVPAALPGLWTSMAIAVRLPAAARLPAGHPTPALPRPQRPPIA